MLKELQMRKSNLNLYDGIGTWKRRPIRAGKKTYMPSHKRWGKITVTKMPTPEGQITGSEIWQQQPKLVRVACHHCAKEYDVAEENVRVDNYCTECK